MKVSPLQTSSQQLGYSDARSIPSTSRTWVAERLQSVKRHQRNSVAVASSSGWNGNSPYTTSGTPVGASDRVQDFLKSPFDLATFGPRLAVGALLSAQETVGNLQADLERVNILIQDPRPVQDKQQAVAQEVELRLAKYLKRGADVEAGVLSAVAAVLPPDVQQQLPPQLQDVLFRATAATTAAPSPIIEEELEPVPIATVTRNQSAAELEELKASVVELREAIADLAANGDPSQSGMLRVKIVDARSGLSRRLQQLSPFALRSTEAPVAEAVAEAKILLQEAEAVRF